LGPQPTDRSGLRSLISTSTPNSRPTSHSTAIMNTMPTQRPFFANFLAAFRAHSAIQQQSKGPTPSTSQASHSTATSNTTSTSTATNSAPSHPRSIATKAPGSTTTALNQLHSPRATSTSPLSRSPGQSSPNYMQRSESANRRRGSDSSSEGFRDVLGAEKWYIGGRTAAGEERFFKLGVVRRERSIDRLSLDRLSL